MIPGEYFLSDKDITANEGRQTATLSVINTGDRPVQVGSHFHFFEINKELEMDREKAFGMRLDIPAGTAVRFEPGEIKTVQLVTFGGHQHVSGFNNLTNATTISDRNRNEAMKKLKTANFKNKKL